MNSSKSTSRYVLIAVFAAVSYLLMFFEFTILPGVSFLKLDFAEIPILVTFCLLGLRSGILTIIVRSLLYLLVTGFEASHLIGVLANVMASLALGITFYVVQALLIKKTNYSFTIRYLIAAVSATMVLTVTLAILNYFVLMPLYMAVLNMKLSVSLASYVLYAVIPFNLLKGCVLMTVFCVIYHRIAAWVARHQVVAISKQ